jgi:hypothetical protein
MAVIGGHDALAAPPVTEASNHVHGVALAGVFSGHYNYSLDEKLIAPSAPMPMAKKQNPAGGALTRWPPAGFLFVVAKELE